MNLCKMKISLATTFFLVFIAVLSVVEAQLDGSEDIAFPIVSDNLKDKNKDGRNPMFAPKRCPEDQLLYPGDQESDWICDCAPGYLYHPGNDKCYYAYRQGPCEEGQYLVLHTKEVLPKCLKNPCQIDGMVRYKGQCWKLEKPGGPCPQIEEEGGGILGINATTLEPDCLQRFFPLLNEIKQRKKQPRIGLAKKKVQRRHAGPKIVHRPFGF